MNTILKHDCERLEAKAIYIGKRLPEPGKTYFHPKTNELYKCIDNYTTNKDKNALIQFIQSGKQEILKNVGLSSGEIEMVPIATITE